MFAHRRGTLGALRAALLALGACALAPSVAPADPPIPTIRVTGHAHVTTRPDRVQIDIGVITHAPTSQEAATRNAHDVDAVLAAVRKATGTTAVLTTVSYSLSPNYRYHPNGVEPTLEGYIANNVVQVMLDDLARIGAVIDSAVQAGANRVQGIAFTLRDPDAARTAAVRQAAVNARGEADVLAAALGLKVLRVLTADENSPRITPLRVFGGNARSAAMAADVTTPVESGTLDVNADVTLSVEVGPATR